MARVVVRSQMAPATAGRPAARGSIHSTARPSLAAPPPRLLLVVDRIAGLQPQLAAAVSSRARLAQLPSPRPIGVVQLPVGLPQPLVRRGELDLQPSQLLAQHEDSVGCVSRRGPPCQRADGARSFRALAGGCGFPGWFERDLRGSRASRCAALALRVSTSAITSSVSWSSSHALHEPSRSIRGVAAVFVFVPGGGGGREAVRYAAADAHQLNHSTQPGHRSAGAGSTGPSKQRAGSGPGASRCARPSEASSSPSGRVCEVATRPCVSPATHVEKGARTHLYASKKAHSLRMIIQASAGKA
jgi:hypothetical protein